MANMIPPHSPRRGPGARAERALWEALRGGLGDDWFVYWDLDFVERTRAAEGEVDFLLLHREHGMLVVECKGHGVRRAGDGRWLRMRADGTEQPMESPFAQAQGQVKALVAELRARMRGSHAAHFPFVHGHAVAFPLAEVVQGGLPLDAQREYVLLAEDLGDVRPWVERAFAFWRKASGGAPAPLEPHEFTRFRRQVLHPKLEIVETLSSRIRAEGEALARLSAEQVRVLRGCLESRRLRVSGGAGTGKTVLALEAARRFAKEAKSRVLLVSFNRGLAAHLEAAVRREGAAEGTIDATTFHELCRRASEAMGREFAPPGDAADRDAARRFWDEETPAMLLDAVAAGKMERYDAIVVDEAQDFHREWSALLEECLRDPKEGRLILLYDPGQRIFGRTSGLSDAPAAFSLTVNFRNTRAITKVVAELGRVDMEPHDRAPEGEPPVVLPLESPARVRERLDELVRRLVGKDGLRPEQIVLLTPHRREHSSLAGVDSLGGVAIADAAGDRRGKLLHATIGAFKGLEADVVVLLDVDPSDERCDRRARYVAASRARHQLFVFALDDWTR